MNPIRSAWPDGSVQPNTDRCYACYSRSSTTSRSLSFSLLSSAFSTSTSCWRNTVSMRMRQYLTLFRIISVSLMLIPLRPTPSLRRRHHLTTMPRGVYICITHSTSDIDWQSACVFDLHLCVRSLYCVPLRRPPPHTLARMLLRHAHRLHIARSLLFLRFSP
jgi:hypothetical protein